MFAEHADQLPPQAREMGVDASVAFARRNVEEAHMVDNARALAGLLRSRGAPVEFAELCGENHWGAAPAALNRAIPFLLQRP
jgi:hypothetical protein